MCREIASELRRAIVSLKFIGALMVAFLGLMYGGGLDLLTTESNADAFHVFSYAYEGNNAFWLIVIAAALPYSGSLYEDYSSGCMSLSLVRQTRKMFVAAKVIACGLSGGLVVLLSCTTFFVLCLTICPASVSFEPGHWATLVGSAPFLELLWEGRLPQYWLFFSIAQLMYGAFWSVFGLTASAVFLAPATAYVAPFAGAIASVKAVSIGFLPDRFNFVTLAYGSYFGPPAVSLVVIVGIYFISITVMGVILSKSVNKMVDDEK